MILLYKNRIGPTAVVVVVGGGSVVVVASRFLIAKSFLDDVASFWQFGLRGPVLR